jgi:hypothetical protein
MAQRSTASSPLHSPTAIRSADGVLADNPAIPNPCHCTISWEVASEKVVALGTTDSDLEYPYGALFGSRFEEVSEDYFSGHPRRSTEELVCQALRGCQKR